MTEAHELAEKISEAAHHFDHAHMSDDAFRRRVGLFIGMIACALAITSVLETKAMKQTINANIETNDDYAYYQAKLLRQQIMEGAAQEQEMLLQSAPNLPAETVAATSKRLAYFKKEIPRIESDPQSGNGKKELLEKAIRAEARRGKASEQDEWYELSEGLLQIAVVVASTSVLLASRRLLVLGLGAAALGSFATLCGYLNLFPVPFGS